MKLVFQEVQWKIIDRSFVNYPRFLHVPPHEQHEIDFVKYDYCFYAREYITGLERNFRTIPQTNQLILNLKKSSCHINAPDWHYKIEALWQCTYDIFRLVSQLEMEEHILSWIPGSESHDDVKYDPRLQTVAYYVQRMCRAAPNPYRRIFDVDEIISLPYTIQKTHKKGQKKYLTPHELEQHYQLCSQSLHQYTTVLLLDDVITSGSHFKACKNIILKYYPEMFVIGIMWTKATRRDHE